MNFDLNLLVNLVCVIGSVCFFMAKLDAMTKANKQFYEATINNLKENISQKFAYLEGNLNERFKQIAERFITMGNQVEELKKKHEENNQIKERLAILEYTTKAIKEHNENIEDVVKTLRAQMEK